VVELVQVYCQKNIYPIYTYTKHIFKPDHIHSTFTVSAIQTRIKQHKKRRAKYCHISTGPTTRSNSFWHYISTAAPSNSSSIFTLHA